MYEKLTLDMLTADSVSVRRQQYTVIGGIEYPVGNPHRTAYENNEIGRVAIESELPEAQRNAIMAVWGDTPTVDV